LDEQYNKFILNKEEKKEVAVENSSFKDKEKVEDTKNFYMKKELDDNYKIIDTVLIKLKNIID
jgi:hypothetical protein